ncbi:MAG: 16S rRNA (cytidine(1402)-2'-O)-methyltransferase [Vicinamibacterales bacterium]
MTGTLFVVATPIGNLEDISLRALRILREVALIAAEDTRRTGHLLARYGIQTPTTSLNAHNEGGKVPALLDRLAAGQSIALVSDAGTPTLSDPGGLFIRRALEAGAGVEAIPGPSVVTALLSISGFKTHQFTFLGFPPNKATALTAWIEHLTKEGRPVVFFEAPHRVVATLERVRSVLGDCHIVVGRELTKAHEEVYRGTVSGALGRFAEPIGEFSIAIDLGDQQKLIRSEPMSDERVLAEVASLREQTALSKRAAVQMAARRLGLMPNIVYGIVEKHKKSVE